MKRAIVLLGTLMVFVGVVFAADITTVEPEAPSVTASIETKWGMNLNDSTNHASGFDNDSKITVKIPFTKGSAENVTDSSEIKAKNIELYIEYKKGSMKFKDGGGDIKVEGKIPFGPAYLKVGTYSGLTFNYAKTLDDYYDLQAKTTGTAGLTVGYKVDLFNLEANVNTSLGHEDTKMIEEQKWQKSEFFKEVKKKTKISKAVNKDQIYNFGFKAGITPADIANIDVGLVLRKNIKVGDLSAKEIAQFKLPPLPKGATTSPVNANAIVAGGKIHGTIMEGLTYEAGCDFTKLTLTDKKQAAAIVNDVSAMELYPKVDYKVGGIKIGVGFYMLNIDKYLFGQPAFVYKDATSTNKEFIGTTLLKKFEEQIIEANIGYGNDTFNVNLKGEIILKDSGIDQDIVAYDPTAKSVVNIKEKGEDKKITITADVTPVTGCKIYFEGSAKARAKTVKVKKVGLEFSSDLTGIDNTVLKLEYGGSKLSLDNKAGDKGEFFVGIKMTL